MRYALDDGEDVRKSAAGRFDVQTPIRIFAQCPLYDLDNQQQTA